MAAQPRQLAPRLASVHAAEQRGVFRASVDGLRIGQGRFEMPHPRELPRVLRAVVPLVRAGDPVVDELMTDRRPRLAPIVRALNYLPEPAAGLRRIQPMRVKGRTREVVLTVRLN